jgi:hypothetical protein
LFDARCRLLKAAIKGEKKAAKKLLKDGAEVDFQVLFMFSRHMNMVSRTYLAD